MKIKIILLSCLTMVGCSVTKVPTITWTDKETRTIQLGYEYRSLERPQPKWDQAFVSATGQCKSWGFKDASPASNPKTECKEKDGRGNCSQFFTYTYYQCNLTNEMILNEQKQRDQEVREKVKKQNEAIEIAKKREAETIVKEEQVRKIRYEEENIKKQKIINFVNNQCPSYLRVRESCAVAGDYYRCMEIKLGISNQDLPLMLSLKQFIDFGDSLCHN